MKKLFIIFLAIVLTACSGVMQSEVSQSRDKWEQAGISHYRFELSIGCFCVFSQDMPLVIEVQDSEVVSMKYRNGKPIDASLLENFNKFSTIDRLFSEIEADLDGGADEVIVKYDSAYGFPTEINIDYIKNAADDELYLTVSGFEALP